MAVASMTGFARRDGGDGRVTWTWEIKSVNARGLDVRVRVPSGFERLETRVRSAVPTVCARGTVNVTLTLERASAEPRLEVNYPLLDQLLRLTQELRGKMDADPPRLDGLLGVKGVLHQVEAVEDDPETAGQRETAMAADLDAALAELGEARRQEGAKLDTTVRQHLDGIADLTARARENAAAQPETLRQRLHRQVRELLDAEIGVPEERLAQEAALLASKTDVREELDRLAAHEAAMRELLGEGGAIGRRLDFYCQELNREANTVCSKAADTALTATGVALKNAVEQLREQVQNIE